MLHKTRGIVVNYIRYRENSVIVKIYTEAFGLQSYIVNGVRSSKAKTNRIALFQPLTLLDLVVYHRQDHTLHRISEAKCRYPFRSLPFEIGKSSIAIFISEIMYKTLREEENNSPLFDFLEDAILFLENATENVADFHLLFLSKYAFYLGFGAQSASEMLNQLRDARFVALPDAIGQSILNDCINAPFGANLNVDRQRRNEIVETLVYFYKIHVENFGEIKSLAVLREVLA